MPHDHPIGALLTYPGPQTPALRRLRSAAVEEVRAAITRAGTLVGAARDLGCSYRTLARWRADCPDLADGSGPRNRCMPHDVVVRGRQNRGK